VEGNEGVTQDLFEKAKNVDVLFSTMNFKQFRKWISNQRALHKRYTSNKASKTSGTEQAKVLGKRLRTEVTSDDLDNFDRVNRMCFNFIDWSKLGPDIIDP